LTSHEYSAIVKADLQGHKAFTLLPGDVHSASDDDTQRAFTPEVMP